VKTTLPSFDDELQDITAPVAATAQAAPATAATPNGQAATIKPTQAKAGGNAITTNASDEFEFGDESYKSMSKLPRIKPEKGACSRFFMVEGVKPKARQTHYIDGHGSYLCLGEGCPACQAGGQNRTRIVVLAVRYTNADPKTGKLGNNRPQYEAGWVLLSRANYSQMLDVLPEGSTPYSVDWRLSHANRAFGYEFSVAAHDAAYMKVGDQAAIAELVKEYSNGEELSKKLGKHGTALDMRSALAQGAGTGMTDAKMEDVIDSLD
jgi:hypothetical protein